MTKHKIVLAGCGAMANIWLDYVDTRQDAEIIGLVDIQEQSARSLAKKRGLQVPIFTELSKALDEVDANLVFDVTIPSSHKEIVITSLLAGCHVFGEKPMAESKNDAKEILEIVQKTGKNYAVMQNRRYLKPVRSIERFLNSGKIGKIGSIHANFFLGPHFGGFREVMDHPLILDMAIHTFDKARFMTGSEPISVYCHEYNPPGSWYSGNASAICIFEMSNSVTFIYNGSWCAEGLNTSWDSEWRIVGKKGSITWDGFGQPLCEIVDQTKQPEFISSHQKIDVPNIWHGQEHHFGCLDEMFASIDENRIAETDSSDNIHSIAMVLGAMESAQTGKKVKIESM